MSAGSGLLHRDAEPHDHTARLPQSDQDLKSRKEEVEARLHDITDTDADTVDWHAALRMQTDLMRLVEEEFAPLPWHQYNESDFDFKSDPSRGTPI